MSSIVQTSDCTICIVLNERRYIDRTEHGIVFVPDNKLVDGHLIVAPLVHIASAIANPVITAQVIRLAVMKAIAPLTMVMPIGAEAEQRHPHMYVHLLPSPAVRVAMNKRAGK